MISAQTVTKNSLYTLGSSAFQKLLTLAYFIIVARVFGPEDQGKYSAAIAFATLFGVLIDLGLSSALTRETARTPERVPMFLGQMFIARVILGLIVYGVIVGASFALGYSSELVSMIQISSIAVVIDTITSSCWFILRGFRNLVYESIGSILAILAMIGAGLFAIFSGLSVIALVYAVLFGSIVNFGFALFTLFGRARIPLKLKPEWQTMKYLAIISMPFAAAAIFSRIYTFADVSILAKIAGEQAVGWYAAGNKLILALNVIPGAISASIYPALSTYAVSHKERLGILTERALFFLLLVSAPLGVGIAVSAPSIVSLFYGDAYTPTIPVLQILGIALIFGYLAFPLGALLAAVDRQKTNAAIFGAAALVNVLGNVLLIGRFGAFGSAIAATATMVALFVFSISAAKSVLRPHAGLLLSRAARIVLCAALMGGVVWALGRIEAGFGVMIFAGVVVYALCIVGMRVIAFREISEVYASFLKK